MDLFEQFGITPELQQFATVFSLVFTVVYPLVRWGIMPTVRWVFKRRPRSELFLAIKKKLESSDRKWSHGGDCKTAMTFGTLKVNLGTTSDDWLEIQIEGKPRYWVGHLLTAKEKKEIVKFAYKIRGEMIQEDNKRLAEAAAKELTWTLISKQLDPRVILTPGSNPFPCGGIVFPPENSQTCPPAVESNLTQQESVETAGDGKDYVQLISEQLKRIRDNPTPGMQSVEVLEQRIKERDWEIEHLKSILKCRDDQVDRLNRELGGTVQMTPLLKDGESLSDLIKEANKIIHNTSPKLAIPKQT